MNIICTKKRYERERELTLKKEVKNWGLWVRRDNEDWKRLLRLAKRVLEIRADAIYIFRIRIRRRRDQRETIYKSFTFTHPNLFCGRKKTRKQKGPKGFIVELNEIQSNPIQSINNTTQNSYSYILDFTSFRLSSHICISFPQFCLGKLYLVQFRPKYYYNK